MLSLISIPALLSVYDALMLSKARDLNNSDVRIHARSGALFEIYALRIEEEVLSEEKK